MTPKGSFYFKKVFKNKCWLLFPSVTVKYYGKSSHAAAYPWEGVNALDAAVLAYNNLSLLRQQMKPTWRVHGEILIKSYVQQMVLQRLFKQIYCIWHVNVKMQMAIRVLVFLTNA